MAYAWKERDKSPIDFDFVYTQANKLPSYLSTIYENTHAIEILSKELDAFVEQRNKLKEFGLSLLQKLEMFTQANKKKIREIDALQLSFQKCRENVQFLIDELEKLYLCYQKYLSSYPELLSETARREEFEKNLKNRVDSFQKQLQESFYEESEKRKRWENEASIYLPADLASHLSNPPSRYQIKKY